MIGKLFWLSLERGLSNLLSLTCVIVITRYMSSEDYGSFVYTVSVIAIFSIVGQLGLDGVLVKKVQDSTSEYKKYLGSAVAIKVAVSLVSAAILWIYADLVASHTSTESLILKLSCLALLANAGIGTLVPWFRARNLALEPSVSKILATLTGSLGKIVSAIQFGSLTLIASAHIFMYLIELALLAFFFRKTHVSAFRGWTYHGDIARDLLLSGGYFFIGSVATILCFNIDLILIRNLLGRGSAGEYGVAVQFFHGVQIIPFAILTATFPQLNMLAKVVDLSSFSAYARSIFLALAASSLIVAALFLLLSDVFILLIFGDSYLSSATALKVLSICVPLSFLKQLFLRFFLIYELGRDFFWIELVSLLVNVVLNVLLIPYYGIKGAAIATVASMALSVLAAPLLSPRMRSILVDLFAIKRASSS